MGLQADLNYKIRKGTLLGGKYGTGILANFSNVYSIQKAPINEDTEIGESGTLDTLQDFFKLGDDKYFQEFSLEIEKNKSKTKTYRDIY